MIEILHDDLPVATAARAAAERGHILQISRRHAVIAPHLLPGFTRLRAGAPAANDTDLEQVVFDGWKPCGKDAA